MKFKHELKTAGIGFAVAFIILQLVFYKENPLTILKITAGLFWLFTIPGMAILLFWREKIGNAALLVMGTVLGMAVVGIASYYLGIVGLNIKYSGIILPILVTATALTFSLKKH